MPQSIPPLLRLEKISKQFFGSYALSDINFDLYPGEVHAIFGQNGAGKSTLIQTISGDIQPTSGTIFINEEKIKIHSVHNARELGISVVFQEFALVPQLTIEENLFLGAKISDGLFLNKRKLHQLACDTLERLEFSLKPEQKVSTLSHAEQQMVEIAKAFHTKPSIMILDEPTASLAESETEHLFAMINALKNEGIGIIYITHRIEEIYQTCDRVTILQDGKLIKTGLVADIKENQLVELSTGHQINSIIPKIKHRPGKTLLDIKGLNILHKPVKDVSIHVRAGEIVGIAGLVGSGKSTIGRACFGLKKIESGSITYLDDIVYDDSKYINDIRPRAMLNRGMLYLPPDRQAEGLVMVQNIRENISLPSLGLSKFSSGPLLGRKKEKDIVSKISRRFNFNNFDLENKIKQLSGGTQQKVMLARSLVRDVHLLILDEPTVGVDIGTRASIYKFISDYCETGGAVLLISSDLSELVNLSHRIYVIHKGKLQAELSQGEATDKIIQSHFSEAKTFAS